MKRFYPRFRQRRLPLYRARDGMLFGVCKGLANYADLPVFWLRCILVAAALLTWIVPFVVLYLVAAVFMRPEPVLEPATEEEWEFYNSYASCRSMGLARLKRKFEQLERRTRRIETIVTDREFAWEHRLRSGH